MYMQEVQACIQNALSISLLHAVTSHMYMQEVGGSPIQNACTVLVCCTAVHQSNTHMHSEVGGSPIQNACTVLVCCTAVHQSNTTCILKYRLSFFLYVQMTGHCMQQTISLLHAVTSHVYMQEVGEPVFRMH